MTQQQEHSKLNELIKNSGIHHSIELLLIKLEYYRQSEVIYNNSYSIYHEINEIKQTLNALQDQLDDLIEISRSLETLN